MISWTASKSDLYSDSLSVLASSPQEIYSEQWNLPMDVTIGQPLETRDAGLRPFLLGHYL